MKRKTSRLLMGFCVTALAASFSSGIAIANADGAEQEQPSPLLKMQEGASIRYMDPVGIRFVTDVATDKYNEIIAVDSEAVFGTLIIPKYVLGNTEITAENYLSINAENIVADKWLADTETTKSFACALGGTVKEDGTYNDFPETYYNEDLYAVSYCSYKATSDATENTVIFAENPQCYSVAYIASALQARGETDELLSSITDTVLGESLAFGESEYIVAVDSTAETSLPTKLKAVYSSNSETVVTVDENGKLTGVGSGRAEVTATIGNKTATAIVKVETEEGLKPQISINEANTVNVYNGVKTELPITVQAFDGEGENLSAVTFGAADNATFSVENGKCYVTATADNTAIASTVSVTDTRTNKTATIEFTVNSFKKQFGAVKTSDGEVDMVPGGTFDNPTAAVAKDTSDKVLFAQLNVEAADTYYSEVNFTSTDQSTKLVGLIHSNGDMSKTLAQYVAAYDRNGRYLRLGKFSDFSEVRNELANFDKYTGVYNETDRFPVKIGIARIEGFFYMFVNDVYVASTTDARFNNVNTIPGVMIKFVNGITLQDMTYLTGAEATEKYNELTANGCKIMSAGVFGNGTLGSLNTNNQRFTSGTYSETDGVNLEYTYDAGFPGTDGGISPYMYFDGDFEFEFTYELKQYGMNGDSYKYGDERMEVFLCPASNLTSGEIKKFGAYFYGNSKNTYLFSGTNQSEAFALDETTKLPVNTITFKVTRVDGVVTVTVTENGENGKSVTETFTNSDTLFIRMENIGIAGKYTNIKWSVPTAQVTE